MSKLEVVSSLNTLNLGVFMYAHSNTNRTKKYNPKVYLGTFQTSAHHWNYDYENDPILAPKTWPQSYQSNTQKGEQINYFFIILYVIIQK